MNQIINVIEMSPLHLPSYSFFHEAFTLLYYLLNELEDSEFNCICHFLLSVSRNMIFDQLNPFKYIQDPTQNKVK